MKNMRIDLINDTIAKDKVFEQENRATMLTIDFTGCGVDGWHKFLDYETSDGEKGSLDLGTDDVVSRPISNLLTRKGSLKLNPIAKFLEKDETTTRTQPFSTYLIEVLKTVNAYGDESNGRDDLIMPLMLRVSKLEQRADDTDAYQKVQDDNILAERDKNIQQDNRIGKNEDDISALGRRATSVENGLGEVERDILALDNQVIDNTKEIEWLKEHGGGGEGGVSGTIARNLVPKECRVFENWNSVDSGEMTVVKAPIEAMSNMNAPDPSDIAAWDKLPDKDKVCAHLTYNGGNASASIKYITPYIEAENYQSYDLSVMVRNTSGIYPLIVFLDKQQFEVAPRTFMDCKTTISGESPEVSIAFGTKNPNGGRGMQFYAYQPRIMQTVPFEGITDELDEIHNTDARQDKDIDTLQKDLLNLGTDLEKMYNNDDIVTVTKKNTTGLALPFGWNNPLNLVSLTTKDTNETSVKHMFDFDTTKGIAYYRGVEPATVILTLSGTFQPKELRQVAIQILKNGAIINETYVSATSVTMSFEIAMELHVKKNDSYLIRMAGTDNEIARIINFRFSASVVNQTYVNIETPKFVLDELDNVKRQVGDNKQVVDMLTDEYVQFLGLNKIPQAHKEMTRTFWSYGNEIQSIENYDDDEFIGGGKSVHLKGQTSGDAKIFGYNSMRLFYRDFVDGNVYMFAVKVRNNSSTSLVLKTKEVPEALRRDYIIPPNSYALVNVPFLLDYADSDTYTFEMTSIPEGSNPNAEIDVHIGHPFVGRGEIIEQLEALIDTNQKEAINHTDKSVADAKTAKIVDFASDDRTKWLSEDGLVYQVQGGTVLGYPANYMVIINSKRNFSLTTQLGYTSEKVWTRTVDNNESSMTWVPIGDVRETIPVPFAPGWSDYGGNSWSSCFISRIGNRVHFKGLAKCAPDAKALITKVPAGFRPERIHMVPCLASLPGTSRDQAVRIDINPSGEIFVNHGTNSGMTTPVTMVSLEFSYDIPRE